ncbi:MAG: nucleoside hydrolase [Lachnospiraceae bacterium]|nr:nucleoside hydrolase [Lachnospiraceae bacterium]
MTDSMRLDMLQWREGILDLVLDTDAATEVDDQFAISYVLLSPERFRVQAIYAAPFAMNERAQNPADGMAMSYQEILHVMELCGRKEGCPVFRGSAEWMGDRRSPVKSQAADDLALRAMNYTENHPLYVFAIGAGTNIASALLKNPELRERIVIVWLAGNDFSDSPNVYNIYQDRTAAQCH